MRSEDNQRRTGGEILVDQLVIQGVERVMCVPGESYLAALDALYYRKVGVIAGRAEGDVAMMAEAYRKLTGRPGIICHRDPGATNACHGVHSRVGFDANDPICRSGRSKHEVVRRRSVRSKHAKGT